MIRLSETRPKMSSRVYIVIINLRTAGADPEFQLRGGRT
jgi:hypothetical protein